MGVILDLINFINKQKPAVSAQNLNQMQTNIQTAITELEGNIENTYQEKLEAGDNITIENNVIKATSGGGFNLKTLYEDNTGNVGSKTATIVDDKWTNYKILAFQSCSASGAIYGWSFIVMDENIDTTKKYQLHPLDSKDATGSSTDVGSLRAIKVQFNSETELVAYNRNLNGTDIWLTKIVGIY